MSRREPDRDRVVRTHNDPEQPGNRLREPCREQRLCRRGHQRLRRVAHGFRRGLDPYVRGHGMVQRDVRGRLVHVGHDLDPRVQQQERVHPGGNAGFDGESELEPVYRIRLSIELAIKQRSVCCYGTRGSSGIAL